MAKFHEAPCKYYLNEGNCEKGRDGTYRSYCQKCSKYEPRKGYVPKPNKKKEDKWAYHKDDQVNETEWSIT